MPTLAENVRTCTDRIEKILAHPLCMSFEDLGGVYRVHYPEGYQWDVVQANYARMGKAEAARVILAAMERHWKLY